MMILSARIAAGVCAVLFALTQVQAEDRNAVTVVELFTSQGCSSCPPADTFLGELAGMDDVLALSQHVDYWDHLGWKDPYANPRSTQRQREYARSLRLRYVYTPQMVLDGSHDFVGTNRNDILAYIDSKPSRPRPAIHIGEDSQGKWQVVGIDAIIQDHLADIWLIEFDRQHQTIVKRGENRGRHLTNYNVVRRLEKIGRWRNVALNLPISGTDCRSPSHGCAVLLQGERSGRILAAAKIISDQN